LVVSRAKACPRFLGIWKPYTEKQGIGWWSVAV
jgi:hypothetical protein